MKKYRIVLIVIVTFFMLALVIYPDRYIYSVQNGLNLFAIAVLPALFPFFFFSKILTSLDVASGMGKILKKPLKKLFHSPAVSGYIFVISLLSGYPIGAKLVADCYDMGLINEDEAKNISLFCSTSGPLFIIGTVGIIMLGNKLSGFIILVSHYLGAILNGIVLCNRKIPLSNGKIKNEMIKYDNLLKDSIVSSILSITIVGGYIAIFSMLLDVLFDMRIISLFANIFSLFKLPVEISEGIVASIVEITRGCQTLSKSGYSMKLIVPICSGVISFGGLSITLQSLTFSSKCKIKPLFYLKSKFSQGILSFFFATVLCLIFF